jgi:hypothetical protein
MNELRLLTLDSLETVEGEIPIESDKTCLYYSSGVPNPSWSLLGTERCSVRVDQAEFVKINENAFSDNDFEAGLALRNSLQGITILHASDNLFWGSLCHREGFEYVYHRWYKDQACKRRKVKERSFCRSRFSGLAGNALSRLWWGVKYLSFENDHFMKNKFFADIHNGDPYFYAKLAMKKNGSQLWQDCSERTFFSFKPYVFGFLTAAVILKNEYENISYDRISKVLSPLTNSYIASMPSKFLDEADFTQALISSTRPFLEG